MMKVDTVRFNKQVRLPNGQIVESVAMANKRDFMSYRLEYSEAQRLIYVQSTDVKSPWSCAIPLENVVYFYPAAGIDNVLEHASRTVGRPRKLEQTVVE